MPRGDALIDSFEALPSLLARPRPATDASEHVDASAK
jgi:phosphoglycolate phosphatase